MSSRCILAPVLLQSQPRSGENFGTFRGAGTAQAAISQNIVVTRYR